MTSPSEKFVPTDGRPLTPHEREVLEILQEECAEVIVAASKMLRFGIGNTDPTTGESNKNAFGLEVGDLHHMLHLAWELELYEGVVALEGNHRKGERLKKYMQTKPEEPAK
jgi:hypothetical protein